MKKEFKEKIFPALIFVVVIVLISVFVFSEVEFPKRESGLLVKEGRVVDVVYDRIFGATFTDYRDELYFDDGTMLMVQDSDLSGVMLNRSGRFYFEKNYFEYEGCWYRFHRFTKVEYYD